ncbi:GINS complex protein [Rhizoctonia solani]|uniref:DNA replication complex GINS protein PSF2 n=1 Tax=Rhizoctonia solani TaxID=456999 RepID=A0A8H7IJ40_9AGAM|nr:GINS complex protein [Rhizoctonia solani]
MALPPALLHGTSPQELEFAASEELVSIVPTISMERIRLMSGVYGPFRPPARTKIPLWFAANLKLKRKCYIVPPEWLNVEWLQEKLREETTQDSFSKMPFRYLEISKILLDVTFRFRKGTKSSQRYPRSQASEIPCWLGGTGSYSIIVPQHLCYGNQRTSSALYQGDGNQGKLFAAPLEGDATMAGTADATFGSGWADSTFDMDTS